MEGKRRDIVWMDWAKLIGIFLVVYGHLLQKTGNWKFFQLHELWNIIYLFHMPLFFILSGYMYKSSHSVKKIFITLVVPYLIYQILFFPAALLVHRSEGFTALYLVKQALGGLLGDGYDTQISYYDCIPCWFIVSIIQIRLLFYFVPINKITSTALMILCPVYILFLHYNRLDLYFCLDSTCMAIPYFLTGYYLAKKDVMSTIKLSGGGIFVHCFV